MKTVPSCTKQPKHLPLKGLALSWVLLVIMVLLPACQVSAQQAPVSAPAVVPQQVAPGQIDAAKTSPGAQRAVLETQAENDKPIFSVEGEVVSAGRFDLAKDFCVKDAIMKSGGLTKNANQNQAQIIRFNKRQKAYYTIYFKVSNALSGEPSDNFVLMDKDRIIIHSLVKNETQELAAGIQGDPVRNLPLLPDDQLAVKKIPQEVKVTESVSLSGEFQKPGKYSITKGERLSSVIARAGGYGPNAYLRAAVFVRERVRQMQQGSLEEMAARIEKEMSLQSSAASNKSISTEDARTEKAETEMKIKLLRHIKNIRATGRITIAVKHLRLLKGSPDDIQLEEGDSLHIPSKPDTVSVTGAVMAEGLHIYSEKLDYKDYIAAAGGYARDADASEIFVIKVDGSAQKLATGFIEWNDKRNRWEIAAFGREISPIEPGDVIVVPQRIARIAWLREIRDITQILMNTGVGAPSDTKK